MKYFFSLFNISCATDLETNALLVLIWANDTDEIKTMKKFKPSFTTASRCDFDLIKLWAELLCSILTQPRSEQQQQQQRQRQGRDGFSYLDVSWTGLVQRTAFNPFHPSALNHLPPPPSMFPGHLSSIACILYLAPVSLRPPPPQLLSSAPQASELGMLSVYYTYIFTSLVSKQTPRAFRGNIAFTPTPARQRSNALLLSCNKTAHLISGLDLIEWFEWLDG